MTLVHRKHPREASRTSHSRENIARNDGQATDLEVVDDTKELYARGPASCPPIILDVEKRPLIRPEGRTHWRELPELSKARMPTGIISHLLKTHHPGIVQFRCKSVVATRWSQYKAAKDNAGHSKADEVESDFWLRYRYEPGYEAAARRHVSSCCKEILTRFKYYCRIQAVVDHFRVIKKEKICDKDAGREYLSSTEYQGVKPTWCEPETWTAMAIEWCSPEWIAKSEKNRANRYAGKFKPHKGGSNSITTICQKLEKKMGYR